jgi:hypothetical protein
MDANDLEEAGGPDGVREMPSEDKSTQAIDERLKDLYDEATDNSYGLFSPVSGTPK